MRGFPNRMVYPDFKNRYQILGAAEIATASDNKSGVYALLDKIEFSREKYRLGHTKVFFRAGALAALEEARDEIVLRLVRWCQGQCYGIIRRKEYNRRKDQRQLIKVAQRNFRKYIQLRNWGWFIIIQKTKPLIGQVNPEAELRLLEEKANKAYGAYEEALNVTKNLEEENKKIEEESKAMMKQLESEQGNLNQYQEKQAKAAAMKADCENQLEDAQKLLSREEQSRQQLSPSKKELEGEVKLVMEDFVLNDWMVGMA